MTASFLRRRAKQLHGPTTVAPVFAGYANVLYEAFNEPIDTTANAGITPAGAWATAFTVNSFNGLTNFGTFVQTWLAGYAASGDGGTEQ